MKKFTIIGSILFLICLSAFFIFHGKLKESSNTYSFQQESISFTKPQNFIVTDHSKDSSGLWLFVSPPSFNLSCFDSYGPLVKISSIGSNDIRFATSSIIAKKDNRYSEQFEDAKYGSNTFSHFRYLSSDVYILFGKTTMLQVEYNPSNCAWKHKNYDSSLSTILSTINFSEDLSRPVYIETEEDKINKIKKVLQEYYDDGRYKDSSVCSSYSSVDNVEIQTLRMKTCLEFFKDK